MEIPRPFHLNRLITRKHNGLVKIVTGLQGVGKTHLLFSTFKRHLLTTGVRPEHLHEIAFGAPENAPLRDPRMLFPRLESALQSDGMHYVLLDDVALLGQFPAVLNSLLRRSNVDVYVTDRHAQGLSRDVVTEFRGRGEVILLPPLSFAECLAIRPDDQQQVWQNYLRFGGLPAVQCLTHSADKEHFLLAFMRNVCTDLIGRHRLRRPKELEALLQLLAARTGDLSNPARLAAALSRISQTTIQSYLDDLADAFLLNTARRFDIRRKRPLLTPSKHYFADLGLRNALLRFTSTDTPAAVENVVFNELRLRGYEVSTGFVTLHSLNAQGNGTRRPLAVDFVCDRGDERFYLQMVNFKTEAAAHQKKQSLLRIKDAFPKVLLTPNNLTHRNDDGLLVLNLFDFLLDPDSLRR